MKHRTVLWRLALLGTVLALAVSAWAPALASDTYTNVAGTIGLGKQGIFIAAPGVRATDVQAMTTTMTDKYHAGGMWSRLPLVSVTFLNSGGKAVKADANAWVFFDLGPAEKAAWLAGASGMSIYVSTDNGKTWATCPTMWVAAGANGRLTCRISANGLYGLMSDNYQDIYFSNK